MSWKAILLFILLLLSSLYAMYWSHKCNHNMRNRRYMMQVWLRFSDHADVLWQLLQGGKTVLPCCRETWQYNHTDMVWQVLQGSITVFTMLMRHGNCCREVWSRGCCILQGGTTVLPCCGEAWQNADMVWQLLQSGMAVSPCCKKASQYYHADVV